MSKKTRIAGLSMAVVMGSSFILPVTTPLMAAPAAAAIVVPSQGGTAKVTGYTVNVRTGAGTSYKSVGLARKGEVYKLTGKASGNWAEIVYKGTNRWISKTYLDLVSTNNVTVETPKQEKPQLPVTTTETNTATVTGGTVNVRTGAGTSHSIVGTVKRGETYNATGKTSGSWTEIVYKGTNRWISSRYVKVETNSTPVTVTPAPKPKPTPTPEVEKVVSGVATVTGGTVNVRTGAGTSHSIVGTVKRGETYNATGKTSGSWTEIVYKGTNRWISSNYVRVSEGTVTETETVMPEPTPAPEVKKTIGTVTGGTVNVRTGAGTSYPAIGLATRGETYAMTGQTSNGWTQIDFRGRTGWISSTYFKESAGVTTVITNPYPGKVTTGVIQLTPSARYIMDYTFENWSQINTIYGWRASSAYSGDHPNGLAVDIMIPRYKTAGSKALGWEIAYSLQRNAKELNIKYVIWNQKIWSVARDREGWRPMADRGGDSANHLDHVHVSVNS